MQDFLEPSPLKNGLSWTAKYNGHDWARRGNFYFWITLYRGELVFKRFPVELDDYSYGDVTCRFTDTEIRQMVREELKRLASRGESNTTAIF
jgi:hypothetical protein